MKLLYISLIVVACFGLSSAFYGRSRGRQSRQPAKSSKQFGKQLEDALWWMKRDDRHKGNNNNNNNNNDNNDDGTNDRVNEENPDDDAIDNLDNTGGGHNSDDNNGDNIDEQDGSFGHNNGRKNGRNNNGRRNNGRRNNRGNTGRNNRGNRDRNNGRNRDRNNGRNRDRNNGRNRDRNNGGNSDRNNGGNNDRNNGGSNDRNNGGSNDRGRKNGRRNNRRNNRNNNGGDLDRQRGGDNPYFNGGNSEDRFNNNNNNNNNNGATTTFRTTTTEPFDPCSDLVTQSSCMFYRHPLCLQTSLTGCQSDGDLDDPLPVIAEKICTKSQEYERELNPLGVRYVENFRKCSTGDLLEFVGEPNCEAVNPLILDSLSAQSDCLKKDFCSVVSDAGNCEALFHIFGLDHAGGLQFEIFTAFQNLVKNCDKNIRDTFNINFSQKFISLYSLEEPTTTTPAPTTRMMMMGGRGRD